MSVFATDFPIAWSSEELSHGSSVLFGQVDDSVHVVAPPGARIQPDEPDGGRACWRYAIWEVDAELGPPAISVDEPDLIADLGTAEVVEILPGALHDFVRVEMARQLCRAETFGKPAEGERLPDRQALLAGRTRSWASAELSSAFPGERWFELEETHVRIPRTVDELLARMPPGKEPRLRSRGQLREIRFRFERFQVKAQSEAFLGLAAALCLIGRRWGRSEEFAARFRRRALDEQCGPLDGHSELTR